MPAEARVRVLVADDSAPFRDVLQEVIEATSDMTWVGEVRDGEEAIEAVARLSPQLLIMDKRMPGLGGIEAARRIRSQSPDTVVILVSVEDPREDALERSGAHAFIPKRELSPRRLAELWRDHGA